jgi:hypothetical protein
MLMQRGRLSLAMCSAPVYGRRRRTRPSAPGSLPPAGGRMWSSFRLDHRKLATGTGQKGWPAPRHQSVIDADTWSVPITARENVVARLTHTKTTRFCPGTQGGPTGTGAPTIPLTESPRLGETGKRAVMELRLAEASRRAVTCQSRCNSTRVVAIDAHRSGVRDIPTAADAHRRGRVA